MGLLDPARPNCSCIRNLLYLDDLQFKIVPAPLCSTDRNECNDGNAGCEHICTNTSGSFICSCDTGYQLDGNGLNCSGKVHLICIVSMSQLTSTPEQKKTKKKKQLKLCHSFCYCADIDECETGNDNCHEKAQCTNTEGSFTCSCHPG